MIAHEVASRTWHQRREPREEIERLEEKLRGAVAKGRCAPENLRFATGSRWTRLRGARRCDHQNTQTVDSTGIVTAQQLNLVGSHPLSSMPSSLRERMRRVVDSARFERAVIVLILINAITLGMETSERAMAAAGPLLIGIDRLILAVFVVELGIRFYVRRLAFFRDPWRVFDLIVVGIALVPATGNLSIFRAFRILRVLRLVGTIASMRRVVEGLLNAMPGMASIGLLLVLIYYVFAVMATKLFGAAFPDWFGTIGASAYSLFQIMTLESWSMGIVRPVMEIFPQAWLFFVPFIVLTTFAVLNLVVGIIVDAMQSQALSDAHAEREAMLSETGNVLSEVRALRAEMVELRSALRKP